MVPMLLTSKGPRMSNPVTVDDDGTESTGLTLTYSATARGFQKIGFVDRYGTPCAIQESSLATEGAIWFGADTLGVRAFPSKTGRGWDPLDVAAIAQSMGYRDVVDNTRMHLTQAQVQALLPLLTYFAEHGELPKA
jgi:hypothetical protein